MVGKTSAEYWNATGPSPIAVGHVSIYPAYREATRRPLTVCNCEQVHEQDDGSNFRSFRYIRVAVVEKRQTSSQEEDTHEGERLQRILVRHQTAQRKSAHDQTKLAASLSVDQEQSGDGENDLNSSISERGVQSLGISVTGFAEDRRTIERNDCEISVLCL